MEVKVGLVCIDVSSTPHKQQSHRHMLAFSILSFSCGYHAVSSVSVSAATRLADSYDIYICLPNITCER